MNRLKLYVFLGMIVLASFGCLKIPGISTAPVIPDGYKMVHIEQIKTDLIVPADWNMTEKKESWQMYILSDVTDPEKLDYLTDRDLMNRDGEYKNKGLFIFSGQDLRFNQIDIKGHQKSLTTVVEEELSKEGDLDIQKVLFTNGYTYLQVVSIENSKSGRFLRLEYRSDKENWEQNKKIANTIINSVKVNPNF